jgi:hypothetical protein
VTLTIDRRQLMPTSEWELLKGYEGASETVRTVPCACGGVLSAIAGDDKGLSRAVVIHRDTPQHRYWQTREGL